MLICKIFRVCLVHEIGLAGWKVWEPCVCRGAVVSRRAGRRQRVVQERCNHPEALMSAGGLYKCLVDTEQVQALSFLGRMNDG